MREIVCAICGGSERAIIYEGTIDGQGTITNLADPYKSHYRINRCRQCDLVYSSPILEPREVRALYSYSPDTNVINGEEANVRRVMEHYYRLAQPFLSGRDRVLDIGCDIGLFLDVARKDGFGELYGIEPNPVAARAAETIPGAIIFREFYEARDFPDEYFDLITLIHVVDHLVDPVQVLEKAWRQLKLGGIVFAVVHNVQSLLSRMLAERFPPYNLYHHYFFSNMTLRRLFEKSGYDVLGVMPTYNYYSLGFFVQRAPVAPVSIRRTARRILDAVGIGRLCLTVPLGNIGIVARRPVFNRATSVSNPITPRSVTQ